MHYDSKSPPTLEELKVRTEIYLMLKKNSSYWIKKGFLKPKKFSFKDGSSVRDFEVTLKALKALTPIISKKIRVSV